MGKFSSLLLGALSGAAAAYFLTSKSGKETTEKIRDFVRGYQENPDDVHEAVRQSAKDFSDQAVTAIKQTKEKVESGEITKETVIESVKDATKSVVDYSQDKFQEIKGRFEKEDQSADETFFDSAAETDARADEADELIVIDLEAEAAEAPQAEEADPADDTDADK